MNALPPFPVDDITLDLLEHAMGGALIFGPDGPQLTGAEFSMTRLLDFMAGVDPDNVTVIQEADPWAGDFMQRVEVVESHDVHYTRDCVISALIAEVRRLRPNAA